MQSCRPSFCTQAKRMSSQGSNQSQGFITVGSVWQVVPDSEVGDPATYHCNTLRLMPLASIDPSLAIGFYCRSAGATQRLHMHLLHAFMHEHCCRLLFGLPAPR